MKYAYFPGCSLHGTGREYDVSVRAVFNRLGLELEEIKKWTCCGASFSLTRTDIVLNLCLEILEDAKLRGADAIAAAGFLFYSIDGLELRPFCRRFVDRQAPGSCRGDTDQCLIRSERL